MAHALHIGPRSHSNTSHDNFPSHGSLQTILEEGNTEGRGTGRKECTEVALTPGPLTFVLVTFVLILMEGLVRDDHVG